MQNETVTVIADKIKVESNKVYNVYKHTNFAT